MSKGTPSSSKQKSKFSLSGLISFFRRLNLSDDPPILTSDDPLILNVPVSDANKTLAESKPFLIEALPPELQLAILNALPPDEKNYLPLRLVNAKCKAITDQDLYLNLLNAPEVLAQTQQPIVSDDDKTALYQQQKKEMDYLLANKDKIFQLSGLDVEKVKKAFSDISILSKYPCDAFSLYQRHKALDVINCLLIERKIDLTKVVLLCTESFLTRFPITLLRDPKYQTYFSALKTINISNNFLTQLPAELFQLPCITVMNASHNQITTVNVPAKVEKNLKIIDLHSNEIRDLCSLLPADIINLSYNYLSTLHEWILKASQKIDITYNCFMTIPKDYPQRAKILKTQRRLDQALPSHAHQRRTI